MKLLFIFIDGIGLGPNDPATNPFALAKMPVLEKLLGGNRLTIDAVPWENDSATLIALDACMGVEGLPQSATGQAALLTGRNISAEIGGHYGPKPNNAVAQALKNGNIFKHLSSEGFFVTFLNAYPPSYFDSIESGRRLYAAIPLAASNAGIRLRTVEDLVSGLAVSADFTAQGWKTHLGIKEIPVISLENAGIRLANLAIQHDFSLFEYWLSDYAGHGQNMDTACRLLEDFDSVLGALISSWGGANGLILITSDHGNMEDLSTRKHTNNPVPALVIGPSELRSDFVDGLVDLTGIAPAIVKLVTGNGQ